MEVTNQNFQDVLPKIKTAIANASFIAIDCELTGLHVGPNICSYDTQAQYYNKIRSASKEFLVIQYGICLFKYDAKQKKFTQQAYNFYIFPRPINKLMPDRRFLCQASSLDFLISQGFDFNKLFKQGIPYLNSTEENKYREELLERQKARADQIQNPTSNNEKSNSGISMTSEDKIKVDEIFAKIEEFIIGSESEYILPRCNAFIRRIVYGEATARLQNRASIETRVLENKDRVLVVTRVKSQEQLEQENNQKIDEEEKEFLACIGFSEVLKCISESRKLIVGHNMMLDLLHTIEKFYFPLPDDYDEFKEIATSLFPNVLDTKYMGSIPPFSNITDSTVLSHLLDTVKKEPFNLPLIEVDNDGEGYGIDGDKSHEAGYDAYITGICFLAMWMYLGNIGEYEDAFNVFSDASSLNRYKNRIFLMKVQDIPCINLNGKDVVPNRDHVLYVTFPSDWKTNDIIHLFSPFGSINIAWVDDQSAYVGLQSNDKTAMALNTLTKGKSNKYTIITYAKHQEQLKNQSSQSSSLSVQSSDELNNSFGKRSITLGRKRCFEAGGSEGYKNPKMSKKTFNEDTDWA